MRTLIISDIHANLPALNAVLAAAEPFDRVWCLGDIVGYGPDPNGCIEKIRDLPNLQCVKGNHDAAILGEIDINAFNAEAKKSLQWLDNKLKPKNKQWLATLEERLTIDDFTIAHGSPRNPVWEYILDIGSAFENMSHFETQYCLVGHSHFPCVFQMGEDSAELPELMLMPLDEPFSLENKSIINPGSVGQPRDRDPRSSFLIFDDEENLWTYHRVEYDVKKVQKRILAAELPKRHASRLSEGW
jgi:diadenosine tetraphosphatase ApaH/serine/threonine PP2A family protein phosphatase